MLTALMTFEIPGVAVRIKVPLGTRWGNGSTVFIVSTGLAVWTLKAKCNSLPGEERQ